MIYGLEFRNLQLQTCNFLLCTLQFKSLNTIRLYMTRFRVYILTKSTSIVSCHS